MHFRKLSAFIDIIIMFNEHKARNTKQGVTGYVVC